VEHSSESALDAHMIEAHHHCRSCDRTFVNRNAVEQHRKSKRHLPARFPCPSSACDARFISESALLKHLEYGRGLCPSGFNRQKIDGFSHNSPWWHWVPLTNLVYEQDQRILRASKRTAWDKDNQVYRCRLCRTGWTSLKSLNAHLASSAHVWRKDLYKCPGERCRKTFGLLSALVEHFENGHCDAHEDQTCKSELEDALFEITRDIENM
jgi:hypothetical protein